MSKSILHNKNDHTCYLCMLLNHDYDTRTMLEEHHVFMGNKERKLAEHYGLKVYLCIQHHRIGPAAVHNNKEYCRMLQKIAQKAFEEIYSHEKWMQEFGRDYAA